MDEHVIQIDAEETLKEHPEWNPFIVQKKIAERNKRIRMLTMVIGIGLYLNLVLFVYLRASVR